MGNSRARAVHDAEGFIKVLADKKTDKILGIHMISPVFSWRSNCRSSTCNECNMSEGVLKIAVHSSYNKQRQDKERV